MDQVSEKKVMRRLQAFRELVSKAYSPRDIIDVLKSDQIVSDKEIHEVTTSYDPTESLFKLLEIKYKDGKLDLLDYEWWILPRRVIVLTIVTPYAKREFRHDEP